jgi:hypothetical protein
LGEEGRDPAWSPKPGRWIAYTSGRQVAKFRSAWPSPYVDAPQGDEEVRLIDASGGKPRKIADGYAPAWSADAKNLHFISGKDQKVKAVEIKEDGSPGRMKDLFGISIDSLVAAISPDGRRVAYLGDERLMVADREGKRTMPTWPVRRPLYDWLLGWSPDGKQLGGVGVLCFGGLTFLNQDTGRALRLGTGELVAPAWSPDGSMIAYDAHLVLGSEIWMIDAKMLNALSSAEPMDQPKGPAARLDLIAPFQPKGKLTYVDLQPKANQSMDLHPFDLLGDEMLHVPRGEQTLGGVKFTIGPGYLHLGSGLLPQAPVKVEGIPVGKHAAHLYILHGTLFSDATYNVADGTTIGYYRVVYEDHSEQSIAIKAGEDVRCWFAKDPEPATHGAKVWEGRNNMAEWNGLNVRLFASGWTNPHPEKKTARIDFLSAGTQAAPFCLAITMEEPASGAGGTAPPRAETMPATRPAASEPAKNAKFSFVDLQDKSNHKLSEKFGNDERKGNFLTIAKGEQTLAGVTFKIGDGVIQLGSTVWHEMPEKVEGIKVGKKFSRLDILHATGYGGGPNEPGTDWYVEDGADIGEYRIHYEDGATATIPIVYGKDVRDWWFREDEKEPSRGKVAWKGDNELAKRYECRLRLYLATWNNPKPDKKVVSIDYISRKDKTAAAPFCAAMTLEEK